MNATLINIGDELLQGFIINTNATFIADEVNKLGINVKNIVTIGDEINDICNALGKAIDESDIIITTGGLGPTSDDKTVDALCKYFNTNLKLDNQALEDVTQFFKNRNIELSETNRKQAFIPENAEVIRNIYGTAPALFFNLNEKFLFVLPGVPFEMKNIMLSEVLPLLEKKSDYTIKYSNVSVFGIGESFLYDNLKEFEKHLPSHINIAYLPKYGKITVRLSEKLKKADSKKSELEIYANQLKSLISSFATISECDSWAELVSKTLKSKKLTLSTAESCTGGNISASLTALPGASDFFIGTVVSYSNDIKKNILKVKNETLNKYGAVSEQTVIEMSKNILNLFKTDFSIAVSGIAGPTGATENKPVGYTWIAVAYKDNVYTRNFNFKYNRELNINHATIEAFKFLFEIINLNFSN